jgi:hypothetical protein
MTVELGKISSKTEEEVVQKVMDQIKECGHREDPPTIATEGKDTYHFVKL